MEAYIRESIDAYLTTDSVHSKYGQPVLVIGEGRAKGEYPAGSALPNGLPAAEFVRRCLDECEIVGEGRALAEQFIALSNVPKSWDTPAVYTQDEA